VVVRHSLGGLVALRLARPAGCHHGRGAAASAGGVHRSAVPGRERSLGRHLARDGAALASDLAGGKLGAVPTVVVSAGEHPPASTIRRAHEQLVAWIPGAELQVWDGTSHPLHIQQPGKVAQAVLALLERA
jgi:pimeloyl-ACP methyl ester carboxylesterase